MQPRYPAWHSLLESYLQAPLPAFQYGVLDCCLFVCGAVKAMTGVDPAEDFRGKYATREEARALLSSAGGFSVIAKRYSLSEVSPSYAGRGDIVQVRGSILGLVSLTARSVIVLSDQGITLLPCTPPVDPSTNQPYLKAWHV